MTALEVVMLAIDVKLGLQFEGSENKGFFRVR